MFDHLKALNTNRLRAWEEAQRLLDHVALERRDMSAEESATWQRMNQEIEDIDLEIRTQIERRDRQSQADVLRETHLSAFSVPGAREDRDDSDRRLRAFLRGEVNGPMEVDIRRVAREKELLRQGAGPDEIRALAWDASSGSLVVPTTMARTLYEYLEGSVAMMRMPTTKLVTSSGENMWLPSVSTHAVGTQVSGQGVALAGDDPVFGRTFLEAYKYGQLVKVSSELIDDSAVDIGGFLGRDIGRALGRVLATDLVVGSGSGEPRGIMTASGAAGAGSIVTGGSLVPPTYEKWVDTAYSLNDEYRSNASGAVWLMKDSTAGDVRKLRDGAGGTVGAPLWQPSTIAGQPDRFLGHALYTDVNVAAAGSNAKLAAFFDPESYVIRTVGNPQIEMDRSRFFDTDEIAVRGKIRADGDIQALGAVTSIVQNVA